jgi:hypothetical protein
MEIPPGALGTHSAQTWTVTSSNLGHVETLYKSATRHIADPNEQREPLMLIFQKVPNMGRFRRLRKEEPHIFRAKGAAVWKNTDTCLMPGAEAAVYAAYKVSHEPLMGRFPC